ncbi:MAG: tRNA pseudouridine(55) synthase TruB [Myxococcota bacterium]
MTPAPSGIAVVDKPKGVTSHDVVQGVRRVLRTRKVGHCGTLDPMATGVLVIAVGQGTKLVPYLTATEKAYEARLQLGVGTDSLDADGTVIEERAVPELTRPLVEARLRAFVGIQPQRAPRVSALRVDGERLHKKARRGDDFEAPLRQVELKEASLDGLSDAQVHFRLVCGKGFYVRSLGRDLAASLGTVGHLTALRRTASGPFRVEEALPVEDLGPETLVRVMDAATRVLPVHELSAEDALHVRHGRPIECARQGLAALVFEGELLAIGEGEGERLRVRRGFAV